MESLRTLHADDLSELDELLDGMDELLDGLDDPDALLAVLADRDSRRTLLALRGGTETDTSLESLASDGRFGHSGSVAATATRLHHLTLPRLDDAGLLEYDAESRTVRYRQCAPVATLLDAPERGGR